MRTLLVLLCLFVSISTKAQPGIKMFLDSTLQQLKAQGKTDKNDMKVFLLLESFYNETLQSDLGELSAKTAKSIHAYVSNKKINNRHLVILFLMYQDHISQTAAKGKRTNVAYQNACINLLESEMQSLYNKVPTIVYIYKAEALQTAGRGEEAKALVDISLKSNPTSIPLQVYKYLDTKDESIRLNLVQNHSSHWMVQQFQIK